MSDHTTLKRQGLYPCELEIARRLSQSEKHWREIVPQLEREGLPKVDPLMGGPYWPAVRQFFENRHQVGRMPPSEGGIVDGPDGEEHFDEP